MKYKDQLKDPRWKARKKEIHELDNWECKNCGENNSELHVHHLLYRSGAMAWEYSNEELITYCGKCHYEWHELKKTIDHSCSVRNMEQLKLYDDVLRVLSKDSYRRLYGRK